MTLERYPLHTDLSLAYRAREGSASTEASLILLLHGLGSNELDLLALEPYLSERLHIVSARAPIPYGPGSYAWFNVQFEPVHSHDSAQARASLEQLRTFVDELSERFALPHERIYLMGFSQGAIMSLSLALGEPRKVAGVVAMSGRVPEEVSEELAVSPDHEGFPILLIHGVHDTVLPIEHGRAARSLLASLPVDLEYREYDMGHEVSEQSLRDILAWLEIRTS